MQVTCVQHAPCLPHAGGHGAPAHQSSCQTSAQQQTEHRKVQNMWSDFVQQTIIAVAAADAVVAAAWSVHILQVCFKLQHCKPGVSAAALHILIYAMSPKKRHSGSYALSCHGCTEGVDTVAMHMLAWHLKLTIGTTGNRHMQITPEYESSSSTCTMRTSCAFSSFCCSTRCGSIVLAGECNQLLCADLNLGACESMMAAKSYLSAVRVLLSNLYACDLRS
jgi:hypothetical protein